MAEELTIGVVANADDAHEIHSLLEEVGIPVAWVGDGSDETVAQFRAEPPSVVVLSAHLNRGDARMLATVMRGGGHPVGIVLVGESDGPVRNALDALDFDIDRFVGRPLSAKAMAFAIKMTRSGKQSAPPAVAAVVDGAATAHLEDRLAAYTDTAIEEFLQDAVAGLGVAGSTSAPAVAPLLNDPDDEAPLLPAREETLILPDGGVSAAAELAEQQAVLPDDSLPARSAAGDGVPESIAAESTEQQSEPPLFDGSIAELGDLGRSLREKMSRMAERLFPDHAAAAAFDGVSTTDAHSEIDLTALGMETVVSDHDNESAPYADIGSADTFTETDSVVDGGSDPALQGEIEVGDDTTGLRGRVDDGSGTSTRRRRSSAPPAARGELSAEVDIASLLAQLYRDGLTGRLVLRRGREEKVLHFDGGRPVFATSNLPHDRMGDLLYREGKITREQHEVSRALVSESGRRMGEILVDRGFLKRRELLPAVRRHIEDIIYSLFSWESGEYMTVPGECAPAEKIRLSRHPAVLIVEGVRRKYGFDMLEHRLGGPAAVPVLAEESAAKQLLPELDLSTVEQRVVDSFARGRSLAEVADRTNVDLLTTYQLAFGLAVLGVVEVSGGSAVVATGGTGAGLWEVGARAPALVGATEIAIDRQRLLAKYAHVAEADYFMLLGVRRDASSFEISRAYENARRDYSAEAFPTEVREQLATEIVEINSMLTEAYEVLSNTAMRDAYRKNLRD